MRKLILPFLLFALTGSVAQNIKNERIQVKYLQLPSTPLDKKYKSYSQKVELYPLSPSESREALTSRMKSVASLKGYERKDAGADLELYIRLEPFVIRNVETKTEERSETKQDKTVIKYNVYFRTYEYKYPIFFRIKDVKKDSTLVEEYWGQDYSSGRTDEVRTYDQLKADWEPKPQQIKESTLSSASNSLLSEIDNKYGFVPAKYYWAINYVETKKVNYDDVVAAKDATQKIFESLSGESAELSVANQEEIVKVIDMWQAILKESNPEDKKARIDRKVTVAILENVAYCYFFLHDFTNALATAQKSRALDRQGWNTTLEQEVKALQARLTANGVAFK